MFARHTRFYRDHRFDTKEAAKWRPLKVPRWNGLAQERIGGSAACSEGAHELGRKSTSDSNIDAAFATFHADYQLSDFPVCRSVCQYSCGMYDERHSSEEVVGKIYGDELYHGFPNDMHPSP